MSVSPLAARVDDLDMGKQFKGLRWRGGGLKPLNDPGGFGVPFGANQRHEYDAFHIVLPLAHLPKGTIKTRPG